ncbi:hypothetical protein SLA2020_146350 [Shorea laevis]
MHDGIQKTNDLMDGLMQIKNEKGNQLKVAGGNMDLRKSKRGNFLTHEDVYKLKYTNKVVGETIRMANIVVFVFRFVSQEVEFQVIKYQRIGKSFCGFDISTRIKKPLRILCALILTS